MKDVLLTTVPPEGFKRERERETEFQEENVSIVTRVASVLNSMKKGAWVKDLSMHDLLLYKIHWTFLQFKSYIPFTPKFTACVWDVNVI